MLPVKPGLLAHPCRRVTGRTGGTPMLPVKPGLLAHPCRRVTGRTGETLMLPVKRCQYPMPRTTWL
jgi:hypothetical protein